MSGPHWLRQGDLLEIVRAAHAVAYYDDKLHPALWKAECRRMIEPAGFTLPDSAEPNEVVLRLATKAARWLGASMVSTTPQVDRRRVRQPPPPDPLAGCRWVFVSLETEGVVEPPSFFLAMKDESPERAGRRVLDARGHYDSRVAVAGLVRGLTP